MLCIPLISTLDLFSKNTSFPFFISFGTSFRETSPPPITRTELIASSSDINSSTIVDIESGFFDKSVSVLISFENLIALLKVFSNSAFKNPIERELFSDFFTWPNISGSPIIIESIPVITFNECLNASGPA